MTFVIRTERDPLDAVPIVTSELAAIDPQVAMSRVRTMQDVVADSLSAPRFRTRILAVFGALALALAAVGLYGVVAFSVSQRSAELRWHGAGRASSRRVRGWSCVRGCSQSYWASSAGSSVRRC